MEFAKYYHVTKTMNKMINDDLLYSHKGSRIKEIYICRDTNDMWVARIYENLNSDFDYEEGCYLLEREKIDLYELIDFIGEIEDTYYIITSKYLGNSFIDDMDDKKMIRYVLQYCDENGLEGWDNREYSSMEDIVGDIDGGYGIIEDCSDIDDLLIYKQLIDKLDKAVNELLDSEDMDEVAKDYYITIGVMGVNFKIPLNADLSSGFKTLLENMIEMEEDLNNYKNRK